MYKEILRVHSKTTPALYNEIYNFVRAYILSSSFQYPDKRVLFKERFYP